MRVTGGAFAAGRLPENYYDQFIRAAEEGGNLAYKPRHKEGYFPVPPSDQLQNIRSEMVLEMQKLGIEASWRLTPPD